MDGRPGAHVPESQPDARSWRRRPSPSGRRRRAAARPSRQQGGTGARRTLGEDGHPHRGHAHPVHARPDVSDRHAYGQLILRAPEGPASGSPARLSADTSQADAHAQPRGGRVRGDLPGRGRSAAHAPRAVRDVRQLGRRRPYRPVHAVSHPVGGFSRTSNVFPFCRHESADIAHRTW